jgi:hypothetical protein
MFGGGCGYLQPISKHDKRWVVMKLPVNPALDTWRGMNRIEII